MNVERRSGMKIEIRNGRVIDPRHGVDRVTTLYIAAGRVAALGAAPSGWSANRSIDASGLVVCPGLIDLSARLREPGFEYKATLESEMRAAVAGGVTSLACPPDTDPPLDEPGLVEMLKYRARSLDRAHVYPIGALTVGLQGLELTEMGELAEAGCVAFSQAEAPLTDTGVLLRAMQYAATFGHRVWLRPQDPLSRQGRRRARRRSRHAPRSRGDPAGRGDDRARDDLRARSRHGRAGSPRPAVDGRRCRDGARRQGGRPARHVRRRRPPSAPLRRGHRLVRCAVPADPAAAEHPRSRCAARRACRRHHRPRVLGPCARRRRRQATAVRRGGAGRDGTRAAVAARR